MTPQAASGLPPTVASCRDSARVRAARIAQLRTVTARHSGFYILSATAERCVVRTYGRLSARLDSVRRSRMTSDMSTAAI